ncbi:O-antigen ligase family protein [Henriciella sp.]|uniref:O-antigen ligase family protein n=1 Tax=Henriciella sp. TaxID=1968823 RepID=UPI0026220E4B|nr:O-antigen ligase family protein [Henriciella sp.]
MASSRTARLVRMQDVARVGICALIPSILFLAHFAHGADALGATAWFGLAACGSLGAIVLMRSARDVPVTTLILFGGLAVWSLLGLTGNWFQARAEVLQLAAGIVFWTAGAMIARSRQLLMTSWSALTASHAVIAAAALLSYPVIAAEVSPAGRTELTRLSFTFASPDVLASLMGMASIVATMHLAYMMRVRVPRDVPVLAKLSHLPRSAYPSIFSLFLCVSCLLLSLSYVAIFLTLAALTAIAATEVFVRRSSETLSLGRHRYLFIGAIVAIFLVSTLFMMASGDAAQSRDALELDSAGHFARLSEYWAAWQHKPFFGHGLGSFESVNASITTMENATALVPLDQANNVVFQWLLQAGLAGLVIMAAVQAWFHWHVFRGTFQAANHTKSYVSRMALTVSAFLLLHNMIDFPLEIPSIMWTYAFLLGLACGMPDSAGVRDRQQQ